MAPVNRRSRLNKRTKIVSRLTLIRVNHRAQFYESVCSEESMIGFHWTELQDFLLCLHVDYNILSPCVSTSIINFDGVFAGKMGYVQPPPFF